MKGIQHTSYKTRPQTSLSELEVEKNSFNRRVHYGKLLFYLALSSENKLALCIRH